MAITSEQQAVLDKWAEQATERSAIEEFLDWLPANGGQVRYAYARSEILDKFFGIDPWALEAARRALLADAAGGGS